MRQRVIEQADRQLPQGDEIFLDHIGHFVADRDTAAQALRAAGFTPTPVSVQANPDGTPTGTGNVCAMLSRGYIEVLFKTTDTPLGVEFDVSIARYAGLHLAAFAIDDVERQHARLSAEGFPMRPLVQFSRPVETEVGPDVAAFSVVRLERGAMAEGRIQMLAHRTEHTVWQPRWLDHPNGAQALTDLVIVSDDPNEAAARFARFTGYIAQKMSAGALLTLDRGRVLLTDAARFGRWMPDVAVPGMPFLGAYALRVASLEKARRALAAGDTAYRDTARALIVPFPAALGCGAWLMVEGDDDVPWL